MKTTLEHALEMAKRGYYIIRLQEDSKVPLRGVRWQDHQTDNKEIIKEWFAENPNMNYGVTGNGADLYIIDVDNKNGKNGSKTYEALQFIHDLPTTLCVHTTTGGRHHYFTASERFGNTAGKLGEGIDTRGVGGYVVGPGCTVDGKLYTEEPSEKYYHKMPPLGESMEAALEECLVKPKHLERSKKLVEEDDYTISRATEYLQHATPSLQGDGGDANAFAVACKVRDFGVGPDTALELMLDHWNERCQPEWDAEDLETKIRNAYNYASSPAGIADPRVEFPPSDLGAELANADPICFPYSHRRGVSIPKREWLYGDLAQAGKITLLVAPPGVGKSTFMLGVAVSKASGRNILGFGKIKQGNVWVYNNEDDIDEVDRRLDAWLQHYDIPDEKMRGHLFVTSGDKRNLQIAIKAGEHGNTIVPKDADAVIAEIKAKNIRMFIVDPFSEIHQANENDNKEMLAVMHICRRVATETNCSVHIIHHDRKPDKANADGHIGNMNSSRGASSVTGAARIIFTLHTMTEKDAKRTSTDEHDRHRYVRLDMAKANMTLNKGRPRWFEKVSVRIGVKAGDLDSGEEVGVLAPIEVADLIPPLTEQGEQLVLDIEALLCQSGAKCAGVPAIARSLISDFAMHTDKQEKTVMAAIKRAFKAEVVNTARGVLTLMENAPDSEAYGGAKYAIKWKELLEEV